MIIIAGSLTIDPAQSDTIRAAAATMMAETHKEPSCQEYVFSISVADPSKVQIFEIWDSAEALEAHFAAPHMAAFGQAIAEVNISGRDLVRYEVASSAPMG
jgi:quinol monooxygenase YgiN